MARNRKERRAAASKGTAAGTGTAFQSTTELNSDGVDFILAHPDRAGPKGKTLFQLAEERQRELNKEHGRPANHNIHSDNTPPGERLFSDEDLIGPLGNAILYSISLATLHLTLDVIVYSQYREEIIWQEVVQRAATALPIFFMLVYIMHVDFSKKFPLLRNLFFFAVSVIAGCYFVYTANVHGYFFVMKAAPPVGSLWIWSVVEMSLGYAVTSAAAVAGYLWWNGFEAF